MASLVLLSRDPLDWDLSKEIVDEFIVDLSTGDPHANGLAIKIDVQHAGFIDSGAFRQGLGALRQATQHCPF